MKLNPLSLLQLKDSIHQFRREHPKVSKFFTTIRREALMPGTVMELTVKDPQGKERVANMRLTENDVKMIGMMLDIGGHGE